eukprot:Plantae.Rhodophyta-Palmaria_palmata.ctg16437.p1 GENE.Plantae.Rhodophyta-Palmaria_palmata.ctg16437~~Plantae.Rhodophyta-Palmaria_palmata.ctg16437.p1  ORF type:complete len:119 (+),score=1.12 Plantae.Rhodophyta-Palmaria_palmata.ctg16437:345-701(+)
MRTGARAIGEREVQLKIMTATTLESTHCVVCSPGRKRFVKARTPKITAKSSFSLIWRVISSVRNKPLAGTEPENTAPQHVEFASECRKREWEAVGAQIARPKSGFSRRRTHHMKGFRV